MSIQENLLKLKNQIPVNVKLIAVSKTKPVQHIIELYDAGHRIFGENRVQELTEKFPQLPADIEWHFIGHLQTNKVKYIAPFVSLIHSVDSMKLLKEIDKEAAKNNRIINCLLEMYIAGEESKFGLDISEAFTILDSPYIKVMHNIRICGVMGMATFTENMELVRKEFKDLKSYFELIKE
ncbi:MAG: YggS family pyridoxal phosphate-dependent enzyme, partial [Bacteroidales bacterium]